MLLSFIKKWFLLLFFIGCSLLAYSQKAQVGGTIKNAPHGSIQLLRHAYIFTRDHFKIGRQEIKLNRNGQFSFSVEVMHPEMIKASLEDSAGNNKADFNFFLSPGDRLTISGDALKNNFKITGKGSNNNQPLAIFDNDSIQAFYKDTLPGRVMTFLQSQNSVHKKVLDEYIQKHHPSPSFVAAWKANLQYEVLDAYFSFETNNAFGIKAAYDRNYNSWFDTRQSLYTDAPLLNEKALDATSYRRFLKYYLVRTKESIWKSSRTNRQSFLLEWYGEDTAAGAKIYMEDPSNDLQQRIIEKRFTGKLKEYLYALLIEGSLHESNIKNLLPVYRQFKSSYPSSEYLELFDDPIREIASRQANKLNAKMRFIDSTGRLKKWEDILTYYKGKTVLLDMWGTWCGPCREEFDKHTLFIKKYFKDKPLDFLYIANKDMGKEKLWRELIAYFNLEGYHILAGDELTKDIMSAVKGIGYPTYVIINKDGTFKLHEYPIKRDGLILQLEEALAR